MGGGGRGAPGARASRARPFSEVALSRTCEHGNQSEAQAAPVCVAMVTPRREGQCRVPHRACAAERALGPVEVLPGRHGTWRAAQTSGLRQHAAKKGARCALFGQNFGSFQKKPKAKGRTLCFG